LQIFFCPRFRGRQYNKETTIQVVQQASSAGSRLRGLPAPMFEDTHYYSLEKPVYQEKVEFYRQLNAVQAQDHRSDARFTKEIEVF
jgi:hypothetical protein